MFSKDDYRRLALEKYLGKKVVKSGEIYLNAHDSSLDEINPKINGTLTSHRGINRIKPSVVSKAV